jgi:hypothetical protein
VTPRRASRARRGAGLVSAPRTPFVVLLPVCATLCGCQSPHGAARGERVVYVNVAALRDMHPAWRVAFAPSATPAGVLRAGTPALPDRVSPPPRIVEIGRLPETAPERQAVGRSSRRDPLAGLKAALDARDARTLARMGLSIRYQVETDMADRKRAMDVRHWIEDGRLEARIARAVRDRDLTDMSMGSRAAIATGVVRQEQNAQIGRLRRAGAREDRQFNLARVALRNRALQELYDFRAEVEEAVAHRLMVRQAELVAATRSEVSSYRAGIGKVLETSRSRTQDRVISGSPQSDSRPASPAAIMAEVRGLASPTMVPVSLSKLAARDARLVTLVDADLQLWSRTLSRDRGWSVRFVPAPDREDVTPVLRDILRHEQSSL